MQANNIKQVCFDCTLDTKLRITSCGKDFEKKYGHIFQDIKGQPYYKIIPLSNNGTKDAFKSVLKNGRPLTIKGQKIICFCGRKKADIHIVPIKDKAGKISGITLRTTAYPDSITLNSLKKSQRLLNIGKVAATLAHGVRSPLNAIKGCVLYIQEKYANEKQLIEFSKIMEDEISRLDHFIANFLSTSISEKSSSQVNINNLLKKIETLISLQAQASNIKLMFQYGRIAPVMISAFHLKHAILNIINNAMDAMTSGGILTVKTEMNSFSGNNLIVIEVSDTGHGIGKRMCDVIALSSQKKGKGLGMFITREILRSYGGSLEIKSDKGLGTCVKLYLPPKRG
jgi:two-component system, NtrC family, nitrogen regulation sensor histidine kinase GlnL